MKGTMRSMEGSGRPKVGSESSRPAGVKQAGRRRGCQVDREKLPGRQRRLAGRGGGGVRRDTLALRSQCVRL